MKKCRSLFQVLDFLAAVATVFTATIAYYAFDLAKEPLKQAELHKRWQNYNEINARYAELYRELPQKFDDEAITERKPPSNDTRRWARRYFDLTSEEYWLHLQGLLPEKTWECRIAPGIVRNFREHKNLIIAYRYWKQEAINIHPADFTNIIDLLQENLLPPCVETRRVVETNQSSDKK